MATLKGQNLRIITTPTGAHAANNVIAMASNCVVTLTNNTEDATHKDVTGLGAHPTVATKGWSVQVDSFDMVYVIQLLSAMQSKQAFTIVWDETSTSNNQSALGAGFARTGQAYISDFTTVFNNRENSTKSIQFIGTGEIETLEERPTVDVVSAFAYTKGQIVRLFLSSDNTTAPEKVIAAAGQLQLHASMSFENASTKDTEGDWIVNEATGISYDISTTALVRSNDTITSSVAAQDLASIEEIYEAGTPVKWKIANVVGANNRTMGSRIAEGSAILTQLTINGPNRQDANYTAQLTGYGEIQFT